MRFMAFLLVAFVFHGALASDYAREQKWADEILPNVVTGDPVRLTEKNQHKFLGLYTEAPNARGAVIVVHGLGVHPDWELIGVLRQQLVDRGYTTLSIQMPVLGTEAGREEYERTFPDADERIALAVQYLKAKGAKKIAIVSHSMGSSMTLHALRSKAPPAVSAWVAIGLSEGDYSGVRVPVLDLFGEKDLPATLAGAKAREDSLKGNSRSAQKMVAGADHFFTGRDADLVKSVADYLDNTL